MDFLEHILGYVMRGCYLLTHNYLVSLILFALAFQIVLFPLGWKQQKNMVKQAMLRPQEMAIRKKYAGRNDQVTMRKMQNELMELQQKNGYSPLAGCLPMLVQMIIIFPLYWIVIRPLQYCGGLTYSQCYKLAEIFYPKAENESFWRNASKSLGMQPASNTFQIDIANKLIENKDNLAAIIPEGTVADGETELLIDAVNKMIDKVGIPDAGVFGTTPIDGLKVGLWFLIFIPIVNLGLMYLSQFVSKKLSYQSIQQETQQGAGSSMKIMMYVLPLMTGYFTATFASAIGIYWIVRTLLSMAQQFILSRVMPYPKFTEEDYKKAEKDFKKGVTTPSSQREYPQREFRSLHHIDDDE